MPSPVIFRQLFDSATWTYTYILADQNTREAVIIDSVREQFDRDLKLIEEMDLKLKFAIETHVHADHITACGQFREATGCATGFSVHDDIECADLKLTDGDKIVFGAHTLKVLETPGHTQGCLSFYGEGMVFTGDALLIRGCGRTDFQGGSSTTLYHSVKDKLLSLPDETLVYPGHDYTGKLSSTVGEEKAHNPRLTLDEAGFVTFMANLNLDPPKRIQQAVPANKACGTT
ncbi:MAG: Zn-dependent hydrolase [Rhodospirillaceae bacterium]|nr:MAG: Zn-dependent hydrolase [Rhodospirillaceae bacterium]